MHSSGQFIIGSSHTECEVLSVHWLQVNWLAEAEPDMFIIRVLIDVVEYSIPEEVASSIVNDKGRRAVPLYDGKLSKGVGPNGEMGVAASTCMFFEFEQDYRDQRGQGRDNDPEP